MIFALIAILLIFVLGLWHYKIRYYFTKDRLYQKLKTHPRWKKIKKIDQFLQKLYQGVNPGRISLLDRKHLQLEQDAYICGEIEFLDFFSMLDKVAPQKGEIFYDLGSASGKAIFAAALFFDLTAARGIEILPGLCKLANRQIAQTHSLLKNADEHFSQFILQKITYIEFINKNFLECDFSDGDIIFLNATCFNYWTWEALVKKLALLKIHSRVIVTSKKITHPSFELITQSFELMSWGMCSVNFYKKTM